MKDNILHESLDAIKSVLKTEENMLTFLGTVLACGVGVSEFLLKNFEFKNIDPKVRYFMSMLYHQYSTIFRPDEIRSSLFDEDFQKYFQSGCDNDKFAMVVKTMYEHCKKEKLL